MSTDQAGFQSTREEIKPTMFTTNSTLNFDGQYASIPARMQEALRRYVVQGIKPGDFLTAVITNNLRDAVGYADDENLPLLKLYVQWFHNVAPSGCHDTAANMWAWLALRHQETLQAP